MQSFKIIVEKHTDGYVAYSLGLQGVVWGRELPTRMLSVTRPLQLSSTLKHLGQQHLKLKNLS